MKRYVPIIVVSVLLILSGVLNLVFYEYWQREEEQVVEAKEIEKSLRTELRALESNKPSTLTVSAVEFIKTMFTTNPDKEKHFDKLLNQTTGELHEQLTMIRESEEYGEVHEHPSEHTEILVKDTLYNMESNTKGSVIITFERVFEEDGQKVKTLNEMEVTLKYVENKWLVEKYTVAELL